MNQTIEDAIELLYQNRFKLKVSGSEKNLLSSLTKQISENVGLTDRQLALCVKKIQNYSQVLTDLGIDVVTLTVMQPTRTPLREIDRSQWVKMGLSSDNSNTVLLVKFDYSKDFSIFWQEIKESLVGKIFEKSNFKEVALVESNILVLVAALKDRGFSIDDDLLKIYEKIEYISEHPNEFLPFIDVDDNNFVIKNTNKNLQKHLDSIESENEEISSIQRLMIAKSCGIAHKSPNAIDKILDLTISNAAKKILISGETRFRLDPDKFSLKDIAETIDTLKIWPVLCAVDEDTACFETVKSICSAFVPYVDQTALTVFFRLSNGQNNHQEFNQFVKDNHLNNYIGPNTKVVVISKNKIPKPLVSADWHPKTAIVESAHDYGKLSTYLNDFENVFYHNKSLQMRHSRSKGAKKIAEL